LQVFKNEHAKINANCSRSPPVRGVNDERDEQKLVK